MLTRRLCVWENDGPVLLSTVFQWALRKGNADMLLATQRTTRGPGRKRLVDPQIEQTAQRVFGENLIKMFNARAWPGTELIGTARVYIVHFNEQLAARMIELENELFKWIHQSPKGLVEDLCLFRKGAAYPLFASVTHDKDAYVMSAGEVSLPGFKRTDYGISEMMLAGDGPYFCLR